MIAVIRLWYINDKIKVYETTLVNYAINNFTIEVQFLEEKIPKISQILLLHPN